jgi:hypothetical protein
MSEPYAAAGAPWGREAGDLGPAKAASPALFFISVPSRDLWNLFTVFVTVYRTPSPRAGASRTRVVLLCQDLLARHMPVATP